MSTPTHTSQRRIRTRHPITIFLLSIALAALAAAPTFASVSEEQQGGQTLNAIHSHKLNATSLSSSQYEHVGEYLMGQALGSVQLHERMNSLMDEMMGPAASDQMHIYLGERYLGKSVEASGQYGPLWGLMGVMMSGYHGSALAGMMGRYLSGAGQANGSGYGSGYGPYMMGNGYRGYMMGGYGPYLYGHDSDMSAGAIIAIVLGSLAVLALLLALVVRLTARRRPTGP